MSSGVQFGKHKGLSVISLMAQYPNYVDWLFKIRDTNSASQHVLNLCSDIGKIKIKNLHAETNTQFLGDEEASAYIDKYANAEFLGIAKVKACSLQRYKDTVGLSGSQLESITGLPTDSLVMYSTNTHSISRVFGLDGSVIVGGTHGT